MSFLVRTASIEIEKHYFQNYLIYFYWFCSFPVLVKLLSILFLCSDCNTIVVHWVLYFCWYSTTIFVIHNFIHFFWAEDLLHTRREQWHILATTRGEVESYWG